MKMFVDERLSAPNVLRVPLDTEVLARAEWLHRLTSSKVARWRLYSQSPPWRSDIRWFSARTRRDFRSFEALFERLDISKHVQPYLDLSQKVRLYNSFLVVRSRCTEPNFHTDWSEANNEGFTLMTPLTDNHGGFGMLYRNLEGSTCEYEYRRGEALIFGDDFEHSTKPGVSKEPVVLLCFNFGTDKMVHWPAIERTAARQALLICRPDGKLQKLSPVRRTRNVIGSALRKSGLRQLRTLPGGY